MIKKKYIHIILIFFIIIILFVSISFLWKDKQNEANEKKDVDTKLVINDLDLDIKFIEGNVIDESISYGNKFFKLIKLQNNNDTSMAFALSFNDVEINNDKLIYSLYYAEELEGSFHPLSEDVRIFGDLNLGYNILIEKHSTLYLKLEFTSKLEGDNSLVKGNLNIVSNLSEKDILLDHISKINTEVMNKIDALNGINKAGYYILKIDTLKEEVRKDYKGYLLINAKDISDIEMQYFIYNDKYTINNMNYTNNKASKSKIGDYDQSFINNLSFESVCKNITKKECYDFNTLKYTEFGGKDNFAKYSKEVINFVMDDFLSKTRDHLIYIYDITKDLDFTNPASITGYILVDNREKKPEY